MTAGRRFLVAFRDADRPAAGSDALQQRLDVIAAVAGIEALRWQRRLAVGADLVASAEVLDESCAARLLDVLRARDDVEYAEADSMLGIAPGGTMPPPPRALG